MNAPASFKLLTPVRTWHDLTAIARRDVDSTRATACIERLRVEAEELAAHRTCDWRVNLAIAQAAQGFVDCPCTPCLDEIDALLADDPLPTVADMRADGLRSYAERTAYAMAGER